MIPIKSIRVAVQKIILLKVVEKHHTHFTKHWGSLPCSKQPSSGPYEPNESSELSNAIYLITTSIMFSLLLLGLQRGLLYSGYTTTICMTLSYIIRVLRGQSSSISNTVFQMVVSSMDFYKFPPSSCKIHFQSSPLFNENCSSYVNILIKIIL